MRLTTKGRYGIRAMVVLASHYKGSPVPVKYISEKEMISTDYIEQLFIKLKKWGLIKSIRGPGGGFLLARPPSKVKIGDILRSVEERIALTPCVETGLDNPRCTLSDNCRLKVFFKRMTDKVQEVMDSVSLADLCKETKIIKRNK